MNLLNQIVGDFQEVTNYTFLHNHVWRWLAFIAVVIVSLLAGRLAATIMRRQARRVESSPRLGAVALLLRNAAGPAALLVLAIGLYACLSFVNLDYTQVVEQPLRSDGIVTNTTVAKSYDWFWRAVCDTLVVLAVSWFAYLSVNLLELHMRRYARRRQTPLANQLAPLVRKVLRVAVLLLAGLLIANNIFNWNISALLAGLGIGGLAIALAAQSALSNFIGSIVIFVDRPFHMGDWVSIKGASGLVEDVGFRSTQISTADGELVTIPNATVANEVIINYSRRSWLRRAFYINVPYDSAATNAPAAIEIISAMLKERAKEFDKTQRPQVCAGDFCATGVTVFVSYCVAGTDWWQFQKFNHDFNLEMIRLFKEHAVTYTVTPVVELLKNPPPDGTILRKNGMTADTGTRRGGDNEPEAPLRGGPEGP
jgi:MscS family membrane protein